MAEPPAERLAALSQYEIQYEDLVFEQQIGSGSFGDVWKGKYKKGDQLVAIKQLHREQGDSSCDEVFCREIETLVAAKHRFLLEFVGFTKSVHRCIVTKFIPNDSLFNALRDDPKQLNLTPTDLNMIAYAMAEGMAFLHSKSLIHRDLKSQNILIDENKLPVICDFGSSRKARIEEELKTGECGTPNYMAPEFIQARAYTNKVDVFSYVMILWEMLTKTVPYENLNAAQAICQIIMRKMPTIPDKTPAPLAQLIEQGWSANPDERPSFEKIVVSFKNGDISWPGCNNAEFQERLMALARKKGTPLLPRFRSKHNYLEANRLPEMFRKNSVRLSKGTPLGDMDILMHTHIEALREMDPVRGAQAIAFISAHVDEPSLLQNQFWSVVLRVLKFGSKDFVELMIPLSVLLAQSSERLCEIRKVTDLHEYVCTASLDIFLYVVSYEPTVITPLLVDKIANLVKHDEARMKAIVLLCKIANRCEDTNIIEKVLDRFQQIVNTVSEESCGVFVIRVLLNHGIVNDNTIGLYLASKIQNNIVAGYQALFIQEETASISPNVNKVDSLLIHLQADNHQLRNVALEFVRRYALRVDGTVLSNIIDALLTAVLRYSSEKAVLLLCKFASDQQRARALLSPGSTSIWLFASPAKAVRMMRVFCVLFKQPAFRKEMILLPEVPAFLSSVLMSNEVEPFLAVCWAIRIADSERDFIIRVDEGDVTEGLTNWLVKTTETRPVQGATSAMASIAQYTYSHAFERVVPRLVSLINEGNGATLHCLMLLGKLSEYKQTLNAFLESNVFAVIARVKGHNDTRAYVAEIVQNLENAGLTFS